MAKNEINLSLHCLLKIMYVHLHKLKEYNNVYHLHII